LAGVKYGVNETNWTKVAADISAQVAAAKVQNGNNVAVYLAAFDEAAQLFEAAHLDSTLSSVQWYGSDGVVQSAVLASNPVAANFAMTHFYPCPTFGLDSHYTASWEPLFTLIKTRTGAELDAFAMAGFDALEVSVAAYRSVGAAAAFGGIKASFLEVAKSYVGATGPTILNPAGDRAGGAFDFWVLRTGPSGAFWKVTGAYEPDPGGGAGRVLLYP
jgi:ABC-type branched-subunit amino acid transport system substrate-binding protein